MAKSCAPLGTFCDGVDENVENFIASTSSSSQENNAENSSHKRSSFQDAQHLREQPNCWSAALVPLKRSQLIFILFPSSVRAVILLVLLICHFEELRSFLCCMDPLGI